MKKVRIIGLMLLALLALGAFAASAAFAEEGLLPQQGEKAASGEGGDGTLEAASGLNMKCKKLTILNILFLPKSDIHATANLHISGCTALGLFTATSLDDLAEPGVILVPKHVTVNLLSQLRRIKIRHLTLT